MRICYSALLALLLPFSATAQSATPAPADTLHKYRNPADFSLPAKKSFFQSKGFRATIVPVLLIGYGASTINGNGLYSSYDMRNDVRHVFGGYQSGIDDYLQWVPYLQIPVVLLAGVESRDDRVNLGLVVIKSGLIMIGSTLVLKHTTNIERPGTSNNRSFPSGHTAQAFTAASIVHTEFRHKSQWYGIGVYALATGVAAFRVINDKHWQSDVVVGAGLGILSAHLAYLSHRNRWGRKPMGRGIGDAAFTPIWTPSGGVGLCFRWQPK